MDSLSSELILKRKAAEESFHDEWSMSTDVSKINVRQHAEACTAPEMRFIKKVLGNLKGRELLDVGCGLGEASVYFALEGATVTSTDLSSGMLHATDSLAKHNGCQVKTHKCDAESLKLDRNTRFDVIYAGNLFHHVNIDSTLKTLTPHLKPGGVLISWDPLKYNPIINIYRRIATNVRTVDEHPLGLRDFKTFKTHFQSVEKKYFWFFTLLVFILMAVFQKRNPNKERFWKAVISEEAAWKPIYSPLEKLDAIVLKILPFLRILCWNVVIICRNPKMP